MINPKFFTLSTLFLLVIVTVYLAGGSPYDIIAGFTAKSLSIKSESFTINLVILTGSNLTYAGEFNISYALNYVNMTKIEAGNGWVLVPINVPKKYVFYREPSAANLPDKTIIATLNFRRKAAVETTRFNVSLTLFKAAGSSGRDLNIRLVNTTVTITVVTGETTGGGAAGGGGSTGGTSTGPNWFLIIGAIASAAIIILSTLYLIMGRPPSCFLVTDGFSIPIPSQGKVFGREDFHGLVREESLSYITRRSKGGQFRIVRFRDGYYIIDNYSANGTFVDGVNIRGKGYIPLRNGTTISIPQVFEAKVVIRMR